MKSKVSIERCQDYLLDNVRGAVKKSFDNLGGLHKFVKPGDKVLIKPNLLSAKDPSRAITTHPSVVQAVAEEVLALQAKPYIGDSPGGADRGVKRVWDNTQMSLASQNSSVPLVSFEEKGVEQRKSQTGKTYYIARPVLEADVIISLAKLKTHTLTLMTGAIKNMFGVIPGFRKGEYHKEAPKPAMFAEVIVDIYSVVKPRITLMDAVVGMEGDGPSSGDPKYLGFLLASEDAVASDAVASKILGFKAGEIDSTRVAAKRGLGVDDFSQIEVTGEKIESVKPASFKLPSNRLLKLVPKFLVDLLGPLVWVRPNIYDGTCTNCNICVINCPLKTISAGKQRPTFDYSNCVNCMCCQELCPQKSIYLEKSWLAGKIAK
ncbi:MAG: hypothetical protein A2W07_09385 [candidate division Zixibacteria bacterium RBG_16_43_9]|nr:MAG: hypothetical protein A2W07_09385 [candidate division Zixibacteria bacterium RBG_16_43_9]